MKSDDTLEAAIETARKAGNLLNRRRGKKRKISYKGAVDLITDVDKESQSLIAGHLQRIFPSHDVLAEEELTSEKGSEFLWLVDPLDGTTNYAHGFPVFCISIALEHRGEIVTGVVYDPARDEMFSARKGKGAALNGKALAVSKEGRLGRSLIATGFPYDIRESEVNNLDHFARMAVRAQAIRRCGSAALDLCYTACGRFDGFWEMKLAPWDMAAGALIVSEAGGRITDFAGNPFRHDGSEILATNGLVHEQMISVLKQGKRE
ncbi:MAG: inositol monophosphatase family protein [Candidatus Aminicenantes bacterium]